jgi:hypothetical protein
MLCCAVLRHAVLCCAVLRHVAFRAGPGGQPARIMFMGADVSHPTNLPGQGKTNEGEEKKKKPDMPSVAAIVGSTNP